ncbi:MAG: hypothetical protein WCW13_04125 [archaeon]
MTDKENSTEKTDIQSHKSVEIKIIDGKQTIHEEEETTKKTKTEKNTDKD